MILSPREAYRELIEKAADAVLRVASTCVIPLFGEDKRGRPDPIGSGVLLEIEGESFLVTAAHVYDHIESSPLYIGDPNTPQIVGEFNVTAAPNGNRHQDRIDFAFTQINKENIKKLRVFKPVKLNVHQNHTVNQSSWYTITGYPVSKAKKHLDPVHQKFFPQLSRYSNYPIIDSDVYRTLGLRMDTHIIISHGKFSTAADGTRVKSFKMNGMSGGPIFNCGTISDPQYLTREADFTPTVAGIMIEQHKVENVAIGTKIDVILSEILR